MKKFKTKVIQADEGIFTHILAYSAIFKHNQSIGIFRTLCNPGIFRTLVYTEQKAYCEPWYIENRGIFRTLVYSEPWHIQNPVKHLLWSVFAKIVNDYNYFHNISFSSFLLYEKSRKLEKLILWVYRSNLHPRSIYSMWSMGSNGTGGQRPWIFDKAICWYIQIN